MLFIFITMCYALTASFVVVAVRISACMYTVMYVYGVKDDAALNCAFVRVRQ